MNNHNDVYTDSSQLTLQLLNLYDLVRCIFYMPKYHKIPTSDKFGTCLRSTIEYLSNHAKRHWIKQFITFDRAIMVNFLQDHQVWKQTLLDHLDIQSFQGDIGSLMDASGLEVITRYMQRRVKTRQSSVTSCEGTFFNRQNFECHRNLTNVEHLCANFC